MDPDVVVAAFPSQGNDAPLIRRQVWIVDRHLWLAYLAELLALSIRPDELSKATPTCIIGVHQGTVVGYARETHILRNRERLAGRL